MIRAVRQAMLALAFAAPAAAQRREPPALRLNDIVAVGTDNSYKQAIPPAEMARPIAADPRVQALDYAHRSLPAQLDARKRDTRRCDAALASGARHLSTDYPWPDRRLSGYRVTLPGGVAAACNPVRADTRCVVGPVDRAGGYLDAADRLDLTRILPGPPVPGSAGAQADARIFVETRALVGSQRWRQAQADVSDDLPVRFRDAIGFAIDLDRLPILARLLARFGIDRSAAVGVAKRHWHVPRPFVGNDLSICEPRTPALAANGDYPSGHTVNGMAFALLLAELLPDRATMLLARGRDYADSRRLCGSHSASAVEGGLLAAAAIIAAAHGSAAFREDMRDTRAELEALRTAPRSPTFYPQGDDR